jgi:carbon dioxide concentrating mechanism protein CcmN
MLSKESSLQAIVLAATGSPGEITPSYRSGDVSIDPSAIIAPGVLLQADLDSRIIIGAGVCIGLDTIIHASGGTLEIQQGSCLAMGVLILGAGTIGKYVCIGSETTAIDPQIDRGEVVPPGSLLGDRSRTLDTVTIDAEPVVEEFTPAPVESTPDPWGGVEAATVETPISTPELSQPIADSSVKLEIPEPIAQENLTNIPVPKSVAGKEHFDRLKRKLFPDIPTGK